MWLQVAKWAPFFFSSSRASWVRAEQAVQGRAGDEETDDDKFPHGRILR